MYSTTCANIHHGVTTFELDGMIQNAIYLKNGTWLFCEMKRTLKKLTFSNFLVNVTCNYFWFGF